MYAPSLRLLSQVSTVLWAYRTSCHPFDFLPCSLGCTSYPHRGDDRISAVLYEIAHKDLARLSDRGMPQRPHLNGRRSVACCRIENIGQFQPHNYFPAQSLHLRYGSAAPCPTLRANVTTSLPRTRYGRLAIPYPTGLPCCVLPAYKDCSRSQWKTAFAVFSVRTLCLLYHTIGKLSRKYLYIILPMMKTNNNTSFFLVQITMYTGQRTSCSFVSDYIFCKSVIVF